jgi:hypothetical protein
MDTESKIALIEIEIKVLNHLDYGHLKAMKLKDLCLRTGEKERKIRIAIESLRRQGWAILIPCEKPFGYFLAENQTELDSYINYMRHRMVEEYHTFRIVKKATLRKFDKAMQIPLFMK